MWIHDLFGDSPGLSTEKANADGWLRPGFDFRGPARIRVMHSRLILTAEGIDRKNPALLCAELCCF
jgi:hypothetical protein